MADLTMTDAQKKYRQDLRDITKTYKSLEDVKAPTDPNIMTLVKVNGNSGVGKWSTAMVTASGQEDIDFTSIPSGVTIIFVTLENIYKGSSNTNTVLQVGNSSGVLTTGYRERNSYISQSSVAGGNHGAVENRIGWVMSGADPQGATYKLNGTYKLFKIGL